MARAKLRARAQAAVAKAEGGPSVVIAKPAFKAGGIQKGTKKDKLKAKRAQWIEKLSHKDTTARQKQRARTTPAFADLTLVTEALHEAAAVGVTSSNADDGDASDDKDKSAPRATAASSSTSKSKPVSAQRVTSRKGRAAVK